MITGYSDFITEKIIYQMLLESKVIFSDKFINVIQKMKSNKVAAELLKISGKDYDTRYNYIDITDRKDTVSFIPDAKAQELRGGLPETYIVTESGRHLTHSNRNDRIFGLLGYEKEGRENWSPNTGTIGLVLNECQSPTTQNRFVLFKEFIEDDNGEARLTVLNKVSVSPHSPESVKVWSTSRNNMRIGRLVRFILQTAGSEFTDKDIEDFTNLWKATYDFMKEALRQFDIIQGDRIAYWYNSDNYVSGGGTLNSSCMSEMPRSTFNIYTKNKQVSLVILYGDDGQIVDGKYTDSKIKGRALLWDCEINGSPAKFMDRIYTRNDSDVELFKQLAQKNGWWFKSSQDMDPGTRLTNGTETRRSARIVVRADKTYFSEYPYMDTMCHISTDEDIITNDEDYDGIDRLCRSTDGDYENM